MVAPPNRKSSARRFAGHVRSRCARGSAASLAGFARCRPSPSSGTGSLPHAPLLILLDLDFVGALTLEKPRMAAVKHLRNHDFVGALTLEKPRMAAVKHLRNHDFVGALALE